MSFGEDIDEVVATDKSGLLEKHSTWERVRAGKVISLKNGVAFPAKYFNSTKGIPVVRIRDILKGDVTTRYNGPLDKTEYVDIGDIIIGMDGDFNLVVWDRPRALLNQRVCKINVFEEFYDQKFLGYALPGYLNAIHKHTSSVTVKHLSSKTIHDIPLPLPPLAEQKRIVDKIERLFSYLDEGERLLEQVKKQISTYRQAVLKAAVTGELTKEWRVANGGKIESGKELLQRILEERRKSWQGRGKYQEPLTPDTSSLPELPEGWTWASLNQLGEFGRGKSKHRPRNDPALFHEGTFPFLQTGEVRSSKGNISEYDRCYNEFGLAQSKLWPMGTLCITIAANIAETGILGFSACFPDSVVGLVAADGISIQYIDYFMRTARENLDRYAPATAQKNINLDILQKVGVPLPPKEEQDEITNQVGKIFDALDLLESTLEAENTRSSFLRQCILKSAFLGELVDQDPNEEPASELLARIQQEEQKQAKTTTPRSGRTSKRSASV